MFRVDHEKKTDGVRVDHEKKSDWVRDDDDKKSDGCLELTLRKRAMG